MSRSRRGPLRRSNSMATVGLQSSTGELLESRQIWSIHRAQGLPGRRLQLGPGGRPTDKSMCLRSAMRRNITLKPGNVSKNQDPTGRQDFAQIHKLVYCNVAAIRLD